MAREEDELERITTRLKQHEDEIAELQEGGAADRGRLDELERGRLGLLARLRALGGSATNGNA